VDIEVNSFSKYGWTIVPNTLKFVNGTPVRNDWNPAGALKFADDASIADNKKIQYSMAQLVRPVGCGNETHLRTRSTADGTDSVKSEALSTSLALAPSDGGPGPGGAYCIAAYML
jgi:hypothetical protein